MAQPLMPRSLSNSAKYPQPLGICPSLWFWSDWDRQRLLVPLVLAVAVPVAPLMHWLTVHLQWSIWPLFFVNTLYPFLIMGLVERHIRRQLRRLVADPGARQRPDPPALPLILFAFLTVTSVALIALTIPLASSGALLVLLTLLAGGALTAALLPRTGRVARQLASSPPALGPAATGDCSRRYTMRR